MTFAKRWTSKEDVLCTRYTFCHLRKKKQSEAYNTTECLNTLTIEIYKYYVWKAK